VGGVHGDAIREITHTNNVKAAITLEYTPVGVFVVDYITNGRDLQDTNGSTRGIGWLKFQASRVVPVANKVQPRAWGSLACVYLGQPVS
jgi:hypothetical protein